MLLKTLWEKEKMLVTSIFSFSHNVFYPSTDEFKPLSHIWIVVCKCFQFGQVQNFVIGKELIYFLNIKRSIL